MLQILLNWNLEILVFQEWGKPEYPEKNPQGKVHSAISATGNLEMLVFQQWGKPEYPEKNPQGQVHHAIPVTGNISYTLIYL